MSGSRWSHVARAEELGGAGPHATTVDGIDLVLLRTARGLKAYEGRCPHQGALLGEGEVEGGALVCRNHRWRFDIETGVRHGGSECLRACAVREENGAIEADVLALTPAAAAHATRKVSDLPGPSSLPILGSAHLLDPSSVHLQVEQWARQYGTPFRFKLGPVTFVAFEDVETFLPVLRERPETFRRPSPLAPVFRELGLASVLSAEGAAWRPQRRLSMEALSQRHLRGFFPTLATVAQRLRRRWAQAADRGDVLDLPAELKRFTVDVTTLLVFGHDVNTLEQTGDVIQTKLELIFPMANRRLVAPLPTWRWFRTPADRRVDRAVAEIHLWIADLVERTRAAVAADPTRASRPANLLEAMLCARDEHGKLFDDETVVSNAMAMLLAGEDTTAFALAWAVHHLTDVPSAVDALRAEIDRGIGGADVPSDIDAANGLAYAGAVANEAMRLRPAIPILGVEALEDTTVGDVEIPKGTAIFCMLRAAAVHPSNFGDPQAFRPARWLDATATGGAHDPGALLPFGSGPRICPGRSLALLEMKMVLAMLYKGFDVERVGASEDVRELFAFTMQPANLHVRLRAREA